MEELEDRGVVGPENGSSPREILQIWTQCRKPKRDLPRDRIPPITIRK